MRARKKKQYTGRVQEKTIHCRLAVCSEELSLRRCEGMLCRGEKVNAGSADQVHGAEVLAGRTREVLD